jgi:hypothetical protein
VRRSTSWRFVLRRGPSRRHRMLWALIDFLRAEQARQPMPARPDAGAGEGFGNCMCLCRPPKPMHGVV